MSRHPQRGSGRSIDVPPNRMADTGRIYLFRKNMVRPGWGNHALKRGRRHTSPPRTTILERFSEQLNAHSEQLNATMCHHDTILVAFTLGSDLANFDFFAPWGRDALYCGHQTREGRACRDRPPASAPHTMVRRAKDPRRPRRVASTWVPPHSRPLDATTAEERCPFLLRASSRF